MKVLGSRNVNESPPPVFPTGRTGLSPPNTLPQFFWGFLFNIVTIMLMQEDGSKNEGSWSFQDDAQAYSANPEPGERAQFQPISWTGSEFISNQKNSSWYFSLAVFIVVICVAIYLITKDILSVVFISIMGILFGVVASRKPRQLGYTVDEDGIKVGTKVYLYSDFKSFSMQQHDAIGYVSLLPFIVFIMSYQFIFHPIMKSKFLVL